MLHSTFSCVDGYGWSCMLLTLLAMLLDENLPAEVAIEIIRQHRGLPAVQTVKVCTRNC